MFDLPGEDGVQHFGKDEFPIDGVQSPKGYTHIQGHGKGKGGHQPVLELAYSWRALWHQFICAHKVIGERDNIIKCLNYL